MKTNKRVILHSDLNSFFASVECMLDPSLRDKAVAVCGSTENRHGIVLAKNGKAKAAGVKTGQAVWEAKKACAELIAVSPHYEQYSKYSVLTRKIYERYTDIIEPFGIDECWLDVTGSTLLFGDGKSIAEKIKESIKSELGLTVSIGVSFNKVFAKLGSDMKKPDAITCIPYESFKEIIWGLPASEILGVGRSVFRTLVSVGIYTIGDIAAASPDFLYRRLGKVGYMLWTYASGNDISAVSPLNTVPPIKSVGHGITAIRDLENRQEVKRVFIGLSQDIGDKLLANHLYARGVQISIRDNVLVTKEYQCRLPYATRSPSAISSCAQELFERSYMWSKNIRTVTVRAISLVDDEMPETLSFFYDYNKAENLRKLDTAVYGIRKRFGDDSVLPAVMIGGERLY